MTIDKNELKVIGLIQRVGELTSGYEAQIIDVRADLTIQVQSLQQENKDLKDEVQKLKTLLRENDVAISTES